MLGAVLLAAVGLVAAPGLGRAAPGDVGVEGPSHAGTSTPTGTKRAESVLWFNDGSWWGNLWDTDTSDFHVFRFDAGTQTWTDTGVTTETRPNTHHDVLWDGTTLYVASHRFVNDGVPAETGHPSTLFRYRYDAAARTYVPLGSSQINNQRTETLVIDKDSTGRLWATWQQGNRIWMNVTGTDGVTWGQPFPHPAGDVSLDDTSALIAYGPGRMGVMWSRQVGDDTDGFYWSYHVDGAAPTTWSQPTTIVSGRRSGDDHMNLKWLDSSGGRVFAAVKTSFTSATQPLTQLFAMDGTGAWSVHTIAVEGECPNRVLLLIDEAAQRLRVFGTWPKPSGSTNAGICSSSGGAIYEKSTPLGAIAFTADKTLRILDADQYVHNASSTKQNLNNSRSGGASTANSGALVIADANATSRYWHYYDGPGGSADTAPPTVSSVAPVDGARDAAVTSTVTATFSEALDPATVSGQTFTLRDPAGIQVPGTVTYDDAARTARLTPQAALRGGTTYTATLTGGAGGVRDVAGNALTQSRTWAFTTVAAAPPPTASFTASPVTGPAPLAVQFTDTSTGSPTGWAWDFGDGGTSTARSPSHTYTTPGTYQVVLTATNASGSSTSAGVTVQVGTAAPQTSTVPVAQDGYVVSGSPNAAFGSSATLWVDGSPVNTAYLQFDLTGLAGRTVVGAVLHLRTTTNPSVGQQAVRLVAVDAWNASTLTYANRPQPGATVGVLGPTAASTGYAVPLDTAAVQGELGQALSLALDSTDGDAVGLTSGETATAPSLELTLAP